MLLDELWELGYLETRHRLRPQKRVRYRAVMATLGLYPCQTREYLLERSAIRKRRGWRVREAALISDALKGSFRDISYSKTIMHQNP